MLLTHIHIKRPIYVKKENKCIITFPGRGLPSSILFRFCRHMAFNRTTIVSLAPFRSQWYPAPNGANDQEKAALGLPIGVASALEGVEMIKKATGFENKDIVLLGFSAGAVIALQLAINADDPFLSCVSLGGAILEPDKVVVAKTQTPIILQHNRQDSCFDWEERYLPMKKSLQENGYNLTVLERPYGYHNIYKEDAYRISNIIYKKLNYGKKFFKKKIEPFLPNY